VNNAQRLGEDSITSLLWRFSIPAVVGMLVHALYNVVDRIFIGRAVGSVGIAGISVAFPMMIIIMAFGMLIGIGANSLISIRLGEQRKAEAEKVLGNAIVLFLIISLTLTALGLVFITPILKLFGASAEILPYSRDYLRIILMGSVFQTVGFGMNNFIRGEGNPKIAMFTMLIGGFLNMILDPIFIFGLGMGIKGAAIATVISQAVSSLWVLSYFLGSRSLLKVRLQNFRLERRIVTGIVAIGSAPFAMQLASSVIISLFNHQLRIYGGTVAISVMGILFSIFMLIMMPVIGISQGAQPIIGYNYGARNFSRVIKTVRLAAIAASSVTLIGFILGMVFPSWIISVFNREDTALIALGPHAMRMFFMMLPIIGFQVVSSNYFQAVGKPRQAILLSLSRQVFLLIPALLILPRFLGLNGVWLAGPVSDLGSALLTGVLLFYELRYLVSETHARVMADKMSALSSE